MASLPFIDISPYLDTSSQPSRRAETAAALNNACTEHGFFYLTGHGVSASITQHVLDLARRFFLDGSEHDKDAIRRQDPGVGDGDGARGYQRIGENVTKGRRDWHEAIDFYAELNGDSTGPPYGLLGGRNLWPYHPPDLKGVYEGYVEEVKRVGAAVVRAMGDALGLGIDEKGGTPPDVFVSATGNSLWVLRMIGYPGLSSSTDTSAGDDAAEQFSCGEHTDYGCLTLLLADATPGALQVQTPAGEWIAADPVPEAFVVNIGDMMERWTNGAWKSTNHRVIHRGQTYRVSVPFFFEPGEDAVVAPLRECVERTGGRPLYEPIVYGPYLKDKIANNFY